MANLLATVYVRYGTSISNRRILARNFPLMAVTTMIVIAIVKSSLALSLGLVGALSIVRFRTAIKEPEELTFLFFTIAIGLGLGADQRFATIVGFLFVVVLIMISGQFSRKEKNENLLLSVSSQSLGNASLTNITEIVREHAAAASIRRFDEGSESLEATYIVEFTTFESVIACKASLKDLEPNLSITFMDNQGLI
jgi:uncharacterized membrane protein YhiD involved in acid resistance